jgi:hypothetical protein
MKKAAALSILVAVVLLGVGVIAEAQQPKKIAKVGALLPSNPAATAHLREALSQGLR